MLANMEGPALQTKWYVRIYPPVGIDFGPMDPGMDYITFAAQSTSIPATNLTTSEHMSTTHTVKYPYNRLLDDHTITFISTQRGFLERRFFETWINNIIAPDTNTLRFRSEYATNIEIIQANLQGDPIYFKVLESAYPINIGSQTLDRSALDAIQTFEVTFTYKYLRSA